MRPSRFAAFVVAAVLLLSACDASVPAPAATGAAAVARWLTNADAARALAQYGFEPAATP